MVLLYHFLLVLIRTKKSRNAVANIGFSIIKNLYFTSVRNWTSGGAFWLKSELFLTKIRTANFDCRASRGRNKNFSARAGKKEGGLGEGIFARPRFRRFFFRRRNFSCQRSWRAALFIKNR
jgi:hypothetical protein